MDDDEREFAFLSSVPMRKEGGCDEIHNEDADLSRNW